MKAKAGKMRLDLLLVDRALVESRELAQSLIMAGKVTADGRKVTKPGTSLPVDAALSLTEPPPYVSRGGVKLAYALERFGVDPKGMTALDVGASTGGFTDCLLQRGAKRVYALDVGRGQLAHRLRQDPRVISMERVNAHHHFSLPERVDIVTIDVSFISATKVAPNALPHLTEAGVVLALVKPQFEAGPAEVGRGGVVKDTRLHARILGRVILWVAESGLRLRALAPSPILGAKGNREFFLMLRRG